jgi:hypothetical protein
MSKWLYLLNSAFYLTRSPLFLMGITWTRVYIRYLPVPLSMAAPLLVLKPHKEDIPMLSFTCAGPLSCAVRVLQYVSVCLMGASGRWGRAEQRLITEKGWRRSVQNFTLLPVTISDETALQSWREYSRLPLMFYNSYAYEQKCAKMFIQVCFEYDSMILSLKLMV